MIMTILNTLAQEARQRVDADILAVSRADMRAQAYDTPIREGFLFEQALSAPGLSFICEVKKASPSKGLIASDFPYLDIAMDYQLAGAAAISVLTEPARFLGSDAHLTEIATRVAVPILRKDFTVDPYQIYQARTLGASAVLLICSLLSDSQLEEALGLATSLGLSCLVEAHNAEEIQQAVRVGARVIGVNNRNLHDFSVNTANSADLRSLVPEDRIFVSESGVTTPADAAQAVRMRADAVLVGESLVRAEDRRGFLREMRNAAVHAFATPMGQQSLCPAIKICGISREEDIPVLNYTLPEYVGFVFHEPSTRYVTLGKACELRTLLNPRIITVGVFVNAPIQEIVSAVQFKSISMVQLHGIEDEPYIMALRKALPGVPIINASTIRDGAGFAAASQADPDYILFDGAEPGSGISFDWSLLEDIRHHPNLPPFFLAGGLTQETVKSALTLGVYGVDVSSGVETGGIKDPAKIQGFISAVRGHHAAQGSGVSL
ncbi:MAG: indole-3-glycerol phosphate synthase TrpC [Propionibacteriaceae bacterium]|jgi:indole-3-glycerol phosphate synthase/phosphoribosylanthranilate isomerase|nr:indole-3-glycerol phosphate synthase TrpC [Propionibacteriaceae bacterium]